MAREHRYDEVRPRADPRPVHGMPSDGRPSRRSARSGGGLLPGAFRTDAAADPRSPAKARAQRGRTRPLVRLQRRQRFATPGRADPARTGRAAESRQQCPVQDRRRGRLRAVRSGLRPSSRGHSSAGRRRRSGRPGGMPTTGPNSGFDATVKPHRLSTAQACDTSRRSRARDSSKVPASAGGAGGSGAGEGNRTLVCSLGSCRSTIELHPHRGGDSSSDRARLG